MHSMLNLEVGELKQQTPHNQCHSCQLRKGHRGYSSRGIAENGQ